MLLTHHYETEIANKGNVVKRRCVLGTHRDANSTVQVTVQGRNTVLKKMAYRFRVLFSIPLFYSSVSSVKAIEYE
jgi:hypothetical protein